MKKVQEMKPVKYQAWIQAEQKMVQVDGLSLSHGFVESRDAQHTWKLQEVVLREFIGITDRFNTDIYEGDICHLRFGHDLLEVRWSVFGFRFFNLKKQEWQLVWAADLKRLEVVGNVYEHDIARIEKKVSNA